ncbi:MAG: hypothetical protein H6Q73_2554 [Firmicutes bacterium]|nr:hypothetical protein [Bacillota bacterium]
MAAPVVEGEKILFRSAGIKRKRVYVAHPLRGDVEGNIKKASAICEYLATRGDILPLSPLHTFGYLDPDGDQFNAMQLCFSLVECADEVWVFGKYWMSEGCMAEIAYAGCRGIRVVIIGEVNIERLEEKIIEVA